ncbi:MAG: peptidase M16 [Bacteroidales bacterium 36-12]|nr:MAG: peptidase M16 [Bacteroidales bacterium 36-12]
MEYQIHTLSNGLRLIHKPDNMAVTYCGMVINAGSRDEGVNEQGIAHFVEHLLFKGTNKRRSSHIINRLENVGGELNAYTSKEETVVYATILNEHLEKAVELIGDIVFHSTFPQKEIDKEKVIIIDEIQSYNDSPSELIYDDFEDIVFDYPIGHNILGKPDLIEKFSSADTKSFVDRFYLPGEMVFFVLGKINDAKLIRWAEKYLVNGSDRQRIIDRTSPGLYVKEHQSIKKDTFQAHYITGNRCFDIHHQDRIGMFLLNNMLGGPGMNSLLNLTLREKNGLVYNVDSVFQPLTDTGIWTVYFGCDESNFKKCEKLLFQVLRKLRDEKIAENQLKKYKMQMLGQMAISMELKENHAIGLGKSLLRYGKVDSMDVIKDEIMRMTSEKLQDIARLVFDENQLSSLKYF